MSQQRMAGSQYFVKWLKYKRCRTRSRHQNARNHVVVTLMGGGAWDKSSSERDILQQFNDNAALSMGSRGAENIADMHKCKQVCTQANTGTSQS